MSDPRGLAALPGIGPTLAGRLRGLGLASETDLLFHRPLRYEDRTRIVPIGRVRPGTHCQVQGRVVDQEIRRGRRRMLVAVLADESGQVLLRFFNFYPGQVRMLAEGNRLRCFGEVRAGTQGLELVHPQCQVLRPDYEPALPEHLTPIYPTTSGVSQQRLAGLVDQALTRLRSGALELSETLDPPAGLPGLHAAITTIHHPPADADLDALIDGHHPAVRRLALEELLGHHLALARLNRARARKHAPVLDDARGMTGKLLGRLSFSPTGAQKRVMAEIAADLASERPMRRLLQGDVGSGKTLVAAAALARAVGSSIQAAIVAPTEILAEQHLRVLGEWFAPLGVEPVWLAGKVTGKARAHALARLARDAPLAVGTHALFQQGVNFADLGLVVVDEQHRFGVHQRLALAAKGTRGKRIPHQLVMTATPIPRTLAMTAYAGLEVSVIDELPPGRKPVTTALLNQDRRGEVVERIRIALGQGRQAYWVCPLIEESEVLQAEAAETTARDLDQALPEFRVGLIHGRMKPADKQRIMAEFAAGEIHLLVATTVIEVGVDVPNASLMMIENAERLGLSQLHQLRGRVGRGADQAACVLLYRPPLGEAAAARLKTMRETTDGFVIAERDLELRGPGEVLGTRQTGMLRFRIADLARDADLLDTVRDTATGLDRAAADVLIARWVGDAEQFADV